MKYLCYLIIIQIFLSGALLGQHDYAGLPIKKDYPNDITVLVNEAYTVGYDETYKNPAWVCYYIPAERKYPSLDRPSRFKEDMRTKAQVSHDDYTNSGYDRGHMCPNYAVASRFGVNAQNETFLMSNVVPQAPDLNQDVWRRHEEDMATIEAPKRKGIWVITGPLYDDIPEKFHTTDIELPDGFFKIISEFDEQTEETKLTTIVIWQDNDKTHDYSDSDFITTKTVDDIEALSGFDFLPMLKKKTEEKVERGEVNW